MQGLYPTEYYPKKGCKRCEDTALPFSQLVHALGAVLNVADALLGSDLESMSAFEQLSFLRESFLAFWEFGINFDQIMQSISSVIAYRQFLNIVADEMIDVIRVNV